MSKYLDEKGVQYLWSKISLEDYPNNELLIAVINAIDEGKADKTEIPSLDGLATETWVEEYIKEHLNNSNGEVVAPSPETPENTTTTTEYVYTYDGDRESTEHSWITNYGNIKVFAKMGDIPEGDLNLVGATIFRTNPNNQWLDRTFTITQEHLDKVLTKSNEPIPATQDGLI